MRAAVEDLTSKTVGSASQFLEVPKVGRGSLALSGVLLKGVTDGESTPNEGASNPKRRRGLPTPCCSSPRCACSHPACNAVYAYEIYDGLKDDNPDLQMASRRDSRRQGRLPEPVHTGDGEPEGLAARCARFRLPARWRSGPTCPPGRYTLEVTVRGRKGKKLERKQWLDFEIRR